MTSSGAVYLVGTGSGDPESLTLREAEVLGRADVVVWDAGVHPGLLRLAPSTSEIVCAQGHPSGNDLPAEEVMRLLAAWTREGKTVVRLSPGRGEASPGMREEAQLSNAEAVQAAPVPGSGSAIPAGWAAPGPLFGRRVVVTRAREQAGELVRLLREQGAEVLQLPAIKILPPREHAPLVEAMAGLNAYDWVVFTSANGVAAFFEAFFRGFEDLRDIGGVRLAAVGPATAEKLRELHLKVDLVPKEYVGREIARELAGYESLENLRVLLLRAEAASPDLPKLLEERGAIVDDVACYRTAPETDDPEGHAARFAACGADWISFTSGSTVEFFNARFDLREAIRRFPGLALASMGPETTKAIRALGLPVAVEAAPHTVEGLADALAHPARVAANARATRK